MKFFLDANLSPHMAIALDALDRDHVVKHLREKFDAATPDPEWITELAGEGGWVIVSGDVGIVKNPQIRKVWQQSRLTAFFFKKAWRHRTLWDFAWRLVKRWPTITQQANLAERGLGWYVPFGSGKFEPVKVR